MSIISLNYKKRKEASVLCFQNFYWFDTRVRVKQFRVALKFCVFLLKWERSHMNSMIFSLLIRKTFQNMTWQTVGIRMLLCLFTFGNFVYRKTNLILKILFKYSVFLYEFLNPQKSSSVLLYKEHLSDF